MDQESRHPPEAPTVTSTSLLERIRDLDGDAWSRFVALYCPLVYDACRRYRVQPADADDVVQEVLQSVSRGIHSFKKERPGDSFRGWLYRIVQNKVRDHFRRTAKHPEGVGGSDFRLAVEQFPEELSADSASNVSGADPALMRALELIRSEFQVRTWTAVWRLTVEGHTAA
jgi:RNA polymerase sigma-70 factor (ECF subfamily)